MQSGPPLLPAVKKTENTVKGKGILGGVEIPAAGCPLYLAEPGRSILSGVAVRAAEVAAVKTEKNLAQPDHKPFSLN